MPFGMVNGMGVLDFGGDRRREGAVWGVNLRRPIVTNGDFVASLCGIAYSDRAVVWRGPRHSCVRWKSTFFKGKGLFLAWFSAFCEIFVQYFTMATYGYTHILIDNRLVCEKLAVFPYARYTVEFCAKFPFFWYSQVRDRSRVDAKFMCKAYL